MIARRGFLAGILGACAAPAIITRPGLLMPVRALVSPALVLLPPDLPAPPFAIHAERWQGGRWHRVELPPLSDAQASALVDWFTRATPPPSGIFPRNHARTG